MGVEVTAARLRVEQLGCVFSTEMAWQTGVLSRHEGKFQTPERSNARRCLRSRVHQIDKAFKLELPAIVILAGAGLWAGAQNALAGGGSFVTLPALILAGLDPLSANVTSTVALFPGQVATGWAGRSMVSGSPSLSVKWLIVISLLGGAMGALLLLSTPVNVFAKLLPYLILFATAVFAWGNFGRKPVAAVRPLNRMTAAVSQLGTAIYGGYFGGGIGFLMLAVFAVMQIPTRNAVATKNVMAAAMNASAFLALVASPFIRWNSALVLSIGAIIGGYLGSAALKTVNERLLKAAIVVFGIVLTAGLFYRTAS